MYFLEKKIGIVFVNEIHKILFILCIIFCTPFSICQSTVNASNDYGNQEICVSLKNYFYEISKKIESGQTIQGNYENMFGISWLEGYVIDKKNNDIILVGKNREGWPKYHTEDLVEVYQNIFSGKTVAPYCSLDPYPSNIIKLNNALKRSGTDFAKKIKECQKLIGGQKVVVGGVSINSRVAKIMIGADYDMKKISQGLLKVKGLLSCIDISIHDNNPFTFKRPCDIFFIS